MAAEDSLGADIRLAGNPEEDIPAGDIGLEADIDLVGGIGPEVASGIAVSADTAAEDIAEAAVAAAAPVADTD